MPVVGARRSDDFMQEFRRLHGELDQLFVDMLGGPRAPRTPTVTAQADVFVAGDPPVLTVQLDVAGVDPEAVEVHLDGDLLVVRGERRRPVGERRVYHHAEIDWGRFERRLRLGVAVDGSGSTASYDRGMLTIALPLAPSRPRASVPVSAPDTDR